ncbi:hypothetical protein SI65_01708 [Aspergillus cristatus]|uniref:Uncharacterized protein n=1 Tax=Aspergillus cristatus TaxID=573508 RepID=A0A1E3BT39_ASPCR|nr:hypothetical protein SI65_01708 [Aspergillus cristatus]
MPIPTRSVSLREPRQQGSSNVTRTATKAPASTAANESALNRRKSMLLPQRHSSVRETPSSTVKTQTQESRLRLPQRGISSNGAKPATGAATATAKTPATTTTATHRRTVSQQQPQRQQQEYAKRPISQNSTATSATSTSSSSGAAIARRQSLRPSPLKTVPSGRPTASTTTATAPTSAIAPTFLTSPRKRAEATRNAPSISPTKKTSMPPPPLPRPARSASLRQPSTPQSGPGVPAAGAKGHTRVRSQIVTPSSTPRLKPSSATPQSSPRKPARGSTAVTPTASTNAAANALAAITAEADPSLMPSSWPEVAAVQTEVLQLYLFHSSSLQKHAEWQAESEAKLRRKYDSVAQKYRSIVDEEKQWQRRLNGQALDYWVQNIQTHNGRLGFAEQIQLLSQTMQEVTELSDEVGGRYTLAVRTFEHWFRKADEIKKIRTQLDSGAADLVVFIDPLDGIWRDEVNDLGMKLELCSRQLQSLDILGYGDTEKLNDSALLRIARGLDDMTNLMLDEIHAMRKIERDIVRSERAWVSQLTDPLVVSDNRPREDRSLRVGMWRSAFE